MRSLIVILLLMVPGASALAEQCLMTCVHTSAGPHRTTTARTCFTAGYSTGEQCERAAHEARLRTDVLACFSGRVERCDDAKGVAVLPEKGTVSALAE